MPEDYIDLTIWLCIYFVAASLFSFALGIWVGAFIQKKRDSQYNKTYLNCLRTIDKIMTRALDESKSKNQNKS